MKKIVLSLSLLALLVACNNASKDNTTATADSTGATTHTTAVDEGQARKDLTAILDSIKASFTRRDPGFVDKYMTEDGLYMGTDPGEVYNFKEFREFSEKSFKDTSVKSYEFDMSKREIRIHGTSANMVEQYRVPGFSQKLMFRNVAHARYENNRWLVDMFTFNVIPKNEDIPKIDKAL